jgi:hypothetical protein
LVAILRKGVKTVYAKGLMEPVLKGQSAVRRRHGGEQGGVGFLAC